MRSHLKTSGRIIATLTLSLMAALVFLPAHAMAFGFLQTIGGGGALQGPQGVDVAPDGTLTVADNSSDLLVQFTPQGAFVRSFGGTGAGDGQFSGVEGVAVNPANGDVYASDSFNNRIQQFSATGVFIRKWGSAGVGNGAFNHPRGLTVGNNSVYVTECGNHRIQQFSLTGSFIAKFGTSGTGIGQFNCPADIAVAADGSLYIADAFNHRIQQLNSGGGFIRAWGSTGTGNGEFAAPYGVAIDASGHVWIADNANNRIQEFDPNGVFLSRYGKNGGDGSSGSGPGEMYSVYQPAFDCRGNLYVADNNNFRIDKFGNVGAGDPPCPVTQPGSTPSTGNTGDKTAPKQVFSYKKRQKLSKLSITIKLDEAAVLEATGSVNVPGASKRLNFKKVKRNAAANSSIKLKLKLSKSNLRKATRALTHHKKLTAKFTIKATDAARNTSANKASIKLKK